MDLLLLSNDNAPGKIQGRRAAQSKTAAFFKMRKSSKAGCGHFRSFYLEFQEEHYFCHITNVVLSSLELW